ncbi:MAG TPA: MaoC/PaaZ C-terminal domain-containing protein [Chloroflexota bacterium]|nr:MaoC/PaaZ C-terminal domain-containing protein [Chloroflexota bacterium]
MIERDVKVGDELPARVKDPISKVQLLKYAGASGDYNLIHTDVETARAVGLGDVIAHGMLSMGFLGQYLTSLAGAGNVIRLEVRFAAMVRLGDVLTCRGIVQTVESNDSGRDRLRLGVWAENQRGERVTTGTAEVFLEGD